MLLLCDEEEMGDDNELRTGRERRDDIQMGRLRGGGEGEGEGWMGMYG